MVWFCLESSSLWKRRRVPNGTEANQASAHRRKFGVIVVPPEHFRKALSIGAIGSMNQSSSGKNLRRKSSHLPEIERKREVNKNNLAPLTEKLPAGRNGGQDLSEEKPSVVPQSAPSVMMGSLYSGLRQRNLHQAPNSMSGQTEHLENHCLPAIKPANGRNAPGDEKEIHLTSPAYNPETENFHRRNSTDGAKEIEGRAKCSRKPPHHLPPLDPSVFEKMSNSPKAVISQEKKPKRRVKRPAVMESNSEICPKKREKDNKSNIKEEDTLPIETDQSEEKIEFAEKKSPSAKRHPAKETSRPTTSCGPVDQREFQMMNHSVDRGKNEHYFHETLIKAPTIVHGEFKARDGNSNRFSAEKPRASRRSSIASSMELLSTKDEVNAQGGNSNRFSAEKSRAPRRCSTVSSPSTETTGKAESSTQFSAKWSVPVIVSRGRKYECDRAPASNNRREEKSSGPFQESPIAICPEYQQAAGFETEPEGFLVEAFPQSDLTSMKYQAIREFVEWLCAAKQIIADSPLTNQELSDRSVPMKVSRGREYESYRAADGNNRREEKSSGPLQERPMAICPEYQQAAGFETDESYIVDSFPQPDVTYQAYQRVRRVGVCSEAESTVLKNERRQARVLMKKFGDMNFPG
ncbi:hypothetical protein OS493_009398 [Desmophyllum pertusum]|uniref:Uncharacterized protein n=1 Tax=Desmophyllum pertusum TaxID=174260 RepID=A0A9X0CS60_9CNID|nr:hypothetical protein OS493_009398 [Desmophyllum pertusum]